MDHGPRDPTEETLEAMREDDTPVRYLVGTPKGRLSRLEKSFLDLPWARGPPIGRCQAPDQRRGALCAGAQRTPSAQGAQHAPPAAEEAVPSAWTSFDDNRTVATSSCSSSARQRKTAGRAWFLVEVDVPHTDEELAAHGFTYRLRRKKLRQVVSARRPLPVAFEHDRRRPCRVVAPLHAAHRNRAGVQGTQAQSCHPPHLPSARGSASRRTSSSRSSPIACS